MSKNGLSRSIKDVSTPTQRYCYPYPYHCLVTHTSYCKCTGSSSADSYSFNSKHSTRCLELTRPLILCTEYRTTKKMHCLYQSLHAPDRTLTGTEPPT